MQCAMMISIVSYCVDMCVCVCHSGCEVGGKERATRVEMRLETKCYP